jgi:hypothetical protein
MENFYLRDGVADPARSEYCINNGRKISVMALHHTLDPTVFE